MRFSELVTFTKQYNKMGGGVLIIIPFYTNYDALSRHLYLLTRQTVQSFDLIIVLNAVSDEEKVMKLVEGSGCKFGVMLAKRKEDTGSAGGYFTGERYAIENGYRAIVIGDDDCLPVEPALLAKSIAAWRGGALATAPEVRFMMDNQPIYTSRAAVFYGLLDISLLKKNGLHYLPMYIGADDAEFSFRSIGGIRIFPVDSFVIHPARHSIFTDFNRSLLYRINLMLLVVPDLIEEYMYNFAGICPVYLIFGSRAARDGALHVLKSVILHRFGKEALPKETPSMESPPERFDVVISSSPSRKGRGALFYDYSQIRGGFNRLPAFAATVAGKVVLLDVVQNYSVLVSMALAKETWIASSGGTYLLARNPGIIRKIAKLCLFALVFPGFLFAGIVMYLISWARKPHTLGYGLR